MLKIKRDTRDKYLLIEIISKDSLNKLNRIFDIKYSKKQVKRKMVIKQSLKDFDFYKKLMEQKPKGGANS
ncbi:unnamed protein product [marine sediment metagenome]|uniref:Uncharacterized protein n=1 Tax=marine sediment metagenome TaxID=412755 RepID=X1JLQ3_9ZZZZ